MYIGRKGENMGTYTLDYIIREWGKGNLTAEQVIGQLLLVIQAIHRQLEHIESKLARLEQASKR